MSSMDLLTSLTRTLATLICCVNDRPRALTPVTSQGAVGGVDSARPSVWVTAFPCSRGPARGGASPSRLLTPALPRPGPRGARGRRACSPPVGAKAARDCPRLRYGRHRRGHLRQTAQTVASQLREPARQGCRERPPGTQRRRTTRDLGLRLRLPLGNHRDPVGAVRPQGATCADVVCVGELTEIDSTRVHARADAPRVGSPRQARRFMGPGRPCRMPSWIRLGSSPCRPRPEASRPLRGG
jgi:hypothetical protein